MRLQSSARRLGGACALMGVLAQPWVAAEGDRYSDCYPCFEALQIAGAGSAVGGRFTGIGELYFLPGIRNGHAGLYALSAAVSRFQELPRIPRSSKEDYLLTIEIVSNYEYAFVIRFADKDPRHAELGWSISLYSQKLQKPKWEKRLAVLLSGRDSTAIDAMRTEIRRSIQYLADRFEEEENGEVYPIVNRFAGEFDRASNVLRQCAATAVEGDEELAAIAALEQVELLRALERADRFLVRGGEDRWRGLLEEDLVEEICRRVSCWDEESTAQARTESQKLVDEISRLHKQMASLRKTHGENWEQPLLESLLREADVDPSRAAVLLERF